jgi:membrane protein implicated in regulation of membrane protease activity
VQPELASYFVVNLPGWLLAGAMAWAAVRWLGLDVWVAAVLASAWIVKDLLLYPFVRRFYRSEPADQRIVGEKGVALSPINPRGFVRVHGEIWQARAAGDGGVSIAEGTPIEVREIHGLLLVVEPRDRQRARQA